jgi:hypothetical protein
MIQGDSSRPRDLTPPPDWSPPPSLTTGTLAAQQDVSMPRVPLIHSPPARETSCRANLAVRQPVIGEAFPVHGVGDVLLPANPSRHTSGSAAA